MPRILDGNRVRDEIKSELKPRVEALAAQGRPPGLAVVLVGHNPASEIYVRNKIKTCHDLGIYSESITPPDSISTEELLAIVEELNARAGDRRHPGAVAAAAAGGYQADPDGRRARQGRRWLPSLQRRRAGGGAAGAARLHAGRHHRAAEARRHSDRRAARRGRGPQRYRRQAGRPCCCCTSTPPSPSAIRRRPTCRPSAARPISWWRRSGAPP